MSMYIYLILFLSLLGYFESTLNKYVADSMTGA